MRESYYMIRKVIDQTFDEEVFNLSEDILKCTSFAPASLNNFTINAEVVPLTIESSTNTTLLSFTVSDIVFNFILTLSSLDFFLFFIKVLPIYFFFINPTP